MAPEKLEHPPKCACFVSIIGPHDLWLIKTKSSYKIYIENAMAMFGARFLQAQLTKVHLKSQCLKN